MIGVVKTPKYAGLADLRRAIASHRVIEFTVRGVTIEAEPMSVGTRHAGKSALVLRCWILQASDGRELGMAQIPYSLMRDMYPTGASFTRRTFYEDSPLGVKRRTA